MVKITFFSVLKNNLECAFCKKKDCPVRYTPERKRVRYCSGTRRVIYCEKEQREREERVLNSKMP